MRAPGVRPHLCLLPLLLVGFLTLSEFDLYVSVSSDVFFCLVYSENCGTLLSQEGGRGERA